MARGNLEAAIAEYTTAIQLADRLIAKGTKVGDKWVILLDRGTTYIWL